MYNVSDSVERKFTDVVPVDEWSILTDTGWAPLIDIKQTVKYTVHELTLDNSLALTCADDHIVFDQNLNEIFVKNLTPGCRVMTVNGAVTVQSQQRLNRAEHMYDVAVDSQNHRFYSNDILSHNTTTAGGYLLWYAMFIPDSTILVAAHKFTGAQEIMARIRYAYELCPDHIRCGAKSYNKQSIEFDNGSRIIAQTTTETTGRGLSLSLLYADEFAFVEPSIAAEFWTSISPTLATGGKAIITSTPNSDEDQFAHIWKEANYRFDQFGDQQELGRNGFYPFRAYWNEHPDRDDVWASEERSRIGEERFRREHDCLHGNTMITLKDKVGKIFEISIGDFFNMC